MSATESSTDREIAQIVQEVMRRTGDLSSPSVEAYFFSAIAAPLAWGLFLFLLTMIRIGPVRTVKALPYFAILLCIHIVIWLFHVLVLKTGIFNDSIAILICMVGSGISTIYFTKYGILADSLAVMNGYSYFRLIMAVTVFPYFLYWQIAKFV